MRTNVLEVENLIRNYRKSVIKESEEDVKVLKGINFQVAEGEFVGIMGKSGCGKTTLLKTLGMIDKPTDGTIKFMGEDTSELPSIPQKKPCVSVYSETEKPHGFVHDLFF